MKRKAGLWIDGSEAVIMVLEDKREEMRRAMSNVDQRVFLSDGAQVVLEEDIQRGQLIDHLREYYDEAVTILIFGPDGAKVEVEKRLENGKLDNRLVGIETDDKMANRQIEVRVRKYFCRKSFSEGPMLSMLS